MKAHYPVQNPGSVTEITNQNFRLSGIDRVPVSEHVNRPVSLPAITAAA
jgi:hypothetical protein